MRLNKKNKISPERTFFNYKEGCLGLPDRNLANPGSLDLGEWQLPGKPVSLHQFLRSRDIKGAGDREVIAHGILKMTGIEVRSMEQGSACQTWHFTHLLILYYLNRVELSAKAVEDASSLFQCLRSLYIKRQNKGRAAYDILKVPEKEAEPMEHPLPSF